MLAALKTHAQPLRYALLVATVAATLVAAALTGCSSHPASDAGSGEASEPAVRFSKESGVYAKDRLDVTLTAPTGYTIAYATGGRTPTADDNSGKNKVTVTLDGSECGDLSAHGDLMSLPYVGVTKVQESSDLPTASVLRAALIDQSGTVSEPSTETYFLGIDFEKRYPGCLVLSVVTDPANLLDYETGIMVLGAVYDEWKQADGASMQVSEGNLWAVEANATQSGKTWERPCSIQVFETSGALVAKTDAGIRATGGASRLFGQKSFNFYFRNDYGAKYFDYELFDGIDRYRSFRMRAGGNNAYWVKFKDAFLMDLVSDRACLSAQTRPAVLFLNGEYWGPYLLSEKISDQMIHDHYGIDKDQVVIMKEGEVEEGKDEDIALYEDLMSYADADLTDPEVWQEFCSVMDVQSFADYCAIRIYVGDADWRPDSNDVLWRTRDTSYNEGKWQYILYDIEFSTGLYGSTLTSPQRDHFQAALERYPLFAAAMENDEFAELFYASLTEIGSVNFNPEHVESTLQEYLDTWGPLMPDFYARFGSSAKNLWNTGLQQMRDFFEQRYDVIVPCVEDWRH